MNKDDNKDNNKDDKKQLEKSLDYIFNIINNLENKSSKTRGIVITVISIMFTLFKEFNISVIMFLVPIYFLFFLDVYYVYTKERYKKLYNSARNKLLRNSNNYEILNLSIKRNASIKKAIKDIIKIIRYDTALNIFYLTVIAFMLPFYVFVYFNYIIIIIRFVRDIL